MNKKVLATCLILAIALLTTSVGTTLARPFYKIRSIEKTYNMILIETHHDLLLIDVRPPTGPPIICLHA